MTVQLVGAIAKTAGFLIALAGAIGALAVIGKAVRAMLRTVRKLASLADEVLGDGEHPGWGRRLTTIEQDVSALRTKVAATLAEVKPNGGGSLKDQITRIETATGATRDEPGTEHP